MAKVQSSTPQLTSPAWAGDFLDREHLVPGGAKLNASSFLNTDAVIVTTSAEALADATTISVTALSGAIPSGTILYFGQSKEFAMLTANAAAGATSLAVQALPATIEEGDTATYAGASGIKPIKSGTLVGRTYAERDANTGFGPAVAASDDEIYLLAFDVTDATHENDCELYRHGSLVKETFLPDWASYDLTTKAKIRSLYTTQIGVA